jgi:hypothetical protein
MTVVVLALGLYVLGSEWRLYRMRRTLEATRVSVRHLARVLWRVTTGWTFPT